MAVGIFKKETPFNAYASVGSGTFTFGTVPAGFTRVVKDLRFQIVGFGFETSNVAANTLKMQNSSNDVLFRKDLGNFFGDIPFFLPILVAPFADTMQPGDKFVHSFETDTGSMSMTVRFYLSFYEQIIRA